MLSIKYNQDININIDGNVINKVSSTKFLGIHIDDQLLTWREHNNTVYTKVSKRLSISLAQYWGDHCLTINQEYRDSWNHVNRMQKIISTGRHDKQLRSYVKDTKKRDILYMDSDNFWGVGKDTKKRDILYMDSDNFWGVGKDFKGLNHIGMILMRDCHISSIDDCNYIVS